MILKVVGRKREGVADPGEPDGIRKGNGLETAVN